jgi:hypothetical protein
MQKQALLQLQVSVIDPLEAVGPDQRILHLGAFGSCPINLLRHAELMSDVIESARLSLFVIVMARAHPVFTGYLWLMADRN